MTPTRWLLSAAMIGGVPSEVLARWDLETIPEGPERLVMSAMKTLVDRRSPLDVVQIATVLRDAGELHTVGGMAYLCDLLNEAP